MYHHDLNISDDADETFFLAVHHLRLAMSMFDRFRPEEFAEALSRASIPIEAELLVSTISEQMELEAWLRDWKVQAAEEMYVYADDDPKIEPIWEKYEKALRERLSEAGQSECSILDELGDMATVLEVVRRERSHDQRS